jgi:hypothetical protein
VREIAHQATDVLLLVGQVEVHEPREPIRRSSTSMSM